MTGEVEVGHRHRDVLGRGLRRAGARPHGTGRAAGLPREPLPLGSTMEMDLWDALAEDELPHDFWVIAPVGG